MRAFLIVFAVMSLGAAGADLPVVHVRNFDKVNAHLYRGGEPSLVGLQELGAMGVATIIDLRESSGATNFEKEQAQKLKLKYINVPLGEFGAPGNAQMEQILTLLQTNSAIFFVHCRRGKDRTGTVIACYRIQHDGWDNHRALEEAKEHGMSSLERAMRAYILNFTPLKVPTLPLIGAGAPVTAR